MLLVFGLVGFSGLWMFGLTVFGFAGVRDLLGTYGLTFVVGLV